MKAVSKALFAIFCYGVSIAMLAQPAESAPISEVATVDGFNGFEQAHTSLYRRMEQSGDSTPTSSNFPSHLDREPIASRTRSKSKPLHGSYPPEVAGLVREIEATQQHLLASERKGPVRDNIVEASRILQGLRVELQKQPAKKTSSDDTASSSGVRRSVRLQDKRRKVDSQETK